MSRTVIISEEYGNIPIALYLSTYSCDNASITPIVPGFRNLLKFYQAINKNVKMYLTVSSYLIAGVGKELAVSVADLIIFRNEEARNKLKKSTILFPRSLDEY